MRRPRRCRPASRGWAPRSSSSSSSSTESTATARAARRHRIMVAPMAVTVPPATDQIDYADLYARWERGNWSATDIDFTQDRIDWREKFTDEQRRGALW